MSKISRENVIEKCDDFSDFWIIVESDTVVFCDILEIVNVTENP